MNHTTKICLGLITALGVNLAAAEPVVPGFEVEIYATVPEPAKLAFAPSGVLYVGNNGSDVKIHRVGVGGSPVEEYGDTLLPDPDSVAFDASGAISGTPGSVLVGNGLNPGFIVAILPDQSTTTVIGTEFGIQNPAYMDFDRTGRLIISDQGSSSGGRGAVAATGEDVIDLGPSFLALTVDGSNRVYSAFLKNQILVIASDGTPLPDLTQYDESQEFFFGLEFGPYDSTWRGDLFAASVDTNIYRIKADGTITLFGSRFGGDNRSDLAFGPDGGLYVSDLNANVIYRITPFDVLQVSIDIKPGDDKNPVNPNSKGKLKVAVITTDEFDASTVDADSVLFGPDEAQPVWYRLDDVDYDGDLDLALKFSIDETGIACGDTEATLTGEEFGGQNITGTDSIKTVGCEPKKCNTKKHHYKHSDDDCGDDEKHRGRHKEKEHHERHYSKHHDDDRDDDHKKW